MKLTDEMLDAIAECARRWNWERLGGASARERIREDLTHVFANLPEPTDTVLELNKRITELQMRLQRVQTWAKDAYLARLGASDDEQPLSSWDWDNLREALGLDRIGP